MNKHILATKHGGNTYGLIFVNLNHKCGLLERFERYFHGEQLGDWEAVGKPEKIENETQCVTTERTRAYWWRMQLWLQAKTAAANCSGVLRKAIFGQ